MQTTLNYNKIDQITDGISRVRFAYKFFSNFSFLGFISSVFKAPVKKALNKMLIAVNELEVVLTDVKDLEKEKVDYLYSHSKKISTDFDRIHCQMEEKNYFNDSEYESLFKGIGRKIHRIENVSRKLSLQNVQFEKTPDYIKQNLSNYSKESMIKHLTK